MLVCSKIRLIRCSFTEHNGLINFYLIYNLNVSSGKDEDVKQDKEIDRGLLVKLVADNKIVMEKSKILATINEKKEVWTKMTQNYCDASGRQVNVVQLHKVVNNMKTSIMKNKNKNI